MNMYTSTPDGDYVPVDAKTRAGLINSGLKKPSDFYDNDPTERTSPAVSVPRVDSTQQESTRVASKDKSTRPTTLSSVGDDLVRAGKNILPTATDTNKTTGQRIVGAVTDITSYPLRAVHGMGQALQQTLVHGPDAFSGTLARGIKSPSAETARTENPNAPGIVNLVRRIGAGIAEDPTSIMAAVAPVQTIGQVASLAGKTAIGHALQRYAQDDNATPIDYIKGAALDALPVAVHGAMSVPARLAGPEAQDAAISTLMKSLKAAPMVRGGQEWEGLKKGLTGKITLNGETKPVFQLVVPGKTSSRADVVSAYGNLKESVDRGFEPALEDLRKAGVSVNIPDMIKKSSIDVTGDVSRGRLPISDIEQTNAERWLAGRAMRPDEQTLALQVREAKHLDPYIPKSGPNKGMPTYKFSNGDRITVEDFNNKVHTNLVEHDPLTAHFKKSEMAKEAFAGDPERQTARKALAEAFARNVREDLTKQTRPGSKGAARSMTAGDDYEAKLAAGIIKEVKNDAGDVVTHTELDEGFWTRDQKRAYKDARKAIQANKNNAKEGYRRQLDNSAPLYAMQDAMDRAMRTGGNKNNIGLTEATLGIAAPLKWFDTPGYARTRYDMSVNPLMQAASTGVAAARGKSTTPAGYYASSIYNVLQRAGRGYAAPGSDSKRYTATPTTQTTVSDTAKGR